MCKNGKASAQMDRHVHGCQHSDTWVCAPVFDLKGIFYGDNGFCFFGRFGILRSSTFIFWKKIYMSWNELCPPQPPEKGGVFWKKQCKLFRQVIIFGSQIFLDQIILWWCLIPQFNFFGHRAANKLLRPPERLKISKLFGRVNTIRIHCNSLRSTLSDLSYSLQKFRGIGPQEK